MPQTTQPPGYITNGPAGPMYAWLAENEITELLPFAATVMINPAVGAITYPSYSWKNDERGFNPEYLVDPDNDGDAGQPIEPRIVKLLVPLTDAARASAAAVREARLGEMKFVEL